MAEHWYLQDGSSFYTIEKADKSGIRDVTLADARKVGAVYSTTKIISQIGKPMLERWKLKQLMQAVREVPPNQIDDWEMYQKRVFARYLENTGKYSSIGTEVHDKLERFYTDGIMDPEDEDMLWPVIEIVNDLDFDLAKPEESFASEKGYGGKIDLILEKLGDSPKTAIIDFKTKQGDNLTKALYDDYCLQLAAYRQAINPKAECYNILISVTHPGVVHLHKWEEKDLKRGWKMFSLLLEYCKLVNKYDPSEFEGAK